MKKVSVVILNWNGRELLQQFLPSVVKYSVYHDAEVVVVDNYSTDESVKFLQENYPRVRLIIFPENYGYAKGYNEALKQIEAEYVVLLNSDVEVSRGWLQTMIDFLDNNPGVTAVQPKILSYVHKQYFEYAGASGGFIDKYGYPFCRGRIFGKIEKDNGQYDTVTDIFWASGACLMIRLKDFTECGGFDSSFFAHMEEIDMCWRLNARGKRIVCLPRSVVYHVGAATLSSESPRKTFLNFRNNLLMLYKNLPDKELKKILKIRIYLDYLAAVQMLFTGRAKNAIAVWRAHREFNKMKSIYNDSRQINRKNTISTQIPTIYPKSILKAFYGKAQKTFDKISFPNF